jgi:isoleucyl-tRNA synthetase
VVTGAIEKERAEKRVGSSLQAAVKIYAALPMIAEALAGIDLAEVCIVSEASLVQELVPAEAFTADVPGIGVVVTPASGEKCQRCWKVLPEVGTVAAHPDLCRRCAAAVDALDDTATPVAAGSA